MRVDVRPRKRNAPRIAEKSAPGFLQWLRGRDCLAVGSACNGRMEAAHAPHKATKGTGTKCADRYAIPLCSFHHKLQHNMGWPKFEFVYLQRFGGALKAAEQLWQAWPGRIAWERKLGAER
jgi:hypothetical protein